MSAAAQTAEVVPIRKPPRMADPNEVSELALELSSAALACRDLGHNWRSRNIETNAQGFARLLRCSRCRTLRRQQLNRRGQVMSNSYDYADNYLFDKPLGRLAGDARSALRLVALNRELEK